MTFIRMTQIDTRHINTRQNHIMQNDTEQNNVYTVTLTRTVTLPLYCDGWHSVKCPDERHSVECPEAIFSHVRHFYEPIPIEIYT
jgi:hypothetical protein